MAAIAKLRYLADFSRKMSVAIRMCSSSKLPSQFGSEGKFYRPLTPIIEKEDNRDYSMEMILLLHGRYDFTWRGYKKWKQRKLEKAIEHDQRFIQHRLDILGPDLAAAHFVVHRGGAVKFMNNNLWFKKNAQGNYILPKKYIPELYIEAIDLFGMPIIFNGLINLENLQHFRWLSFRGCPKVDDFFLDWLGHYRNQLEFLDISNCSLVTERGVSSLARLRKLKYINLSNLVNMKNPELLCLLLDDELPGCKIVGVDYLNPNVLHENYNEEVLVVQPEVKEVRHLT